MAKPQNLPSPESESTDDSESESQQPTKNPCDNVLSACKKPIKPNAKRPADKASTSKGELFSRVFTEEDEIALVEGMIEFKKTNSNPSSKMVAFQSFVKDSLSCDVNVKQIVGKISKLKQKFVCNVGKLQNGEDPMSWKPRDYKLFELSREIWGSEVLGGMEKDKNDDHGGSKTEAEGELWWSLYPCLCASLEAEANKKFRGTISAKEYVNKVVRGLETKRAVELEGEWKNFVWSEV
ncbi:hypothetical protein ACET3Z_013475 [Daucus carota]